MSGSSTPPRVPVPPLLIRPGVERRPVVLATAVALFVGVFLVRQGTSDAETGIALLYVLPVALAALDLGLVAGLVAAVLASGLVVVWTATTPADLGVVGVATRAVVFVAVGGVAGRFSDRMRRLHSTQERLLEPGLELARLEDTAELGERLARHALALPGIRGARVRIGDAAPVAADSMGAQPLRFELEGREAVHGTLEAELPANSAQRAALAMLALQASEAIDNHRLLRSERERARLDAQLGEAEDRLAERGAQLRKVLDGQERERKQVAYEIHEDAAQALAAVLLGLDALERDLGADLDATRVAGLRTYVNTTLESLRHLAVSLRPPVLDGIGLVPALGRLAGDRKAPGLRQIYVQLDGVENQLPPDVETAIYRVVEDATRVTAGEREAHARYDNRSGELSVLIDVSSGGGRRPRRAPCPGRAAGRAGRKLRNRHRGAHPAQAPRRRRPHRRRIAVVGIARRRGCSHGFVLASYRSRATRPSGSRAGSHMARSCGAAQ